jgi:hypothetical protein
MISPSSSPGQWSSPSLSSKHQSRSGGSLSRKEASESVLLHEICQSPCTFSLLTLSSSQWYIIVPVLLFSLLSGGGDAPPGEGAAAGTPAAASAPAAK